SGSGPRNLGKVARLLDASLAAFRPPAAGLVATTRRDPARHERYSIEWTAAPRRSVIGSPSRASAARPKDRAAVARAGLSRARRQHAPAHVAGRPHGLGAGRRAVAH